MADFTHQPAGETRKLPIHEVVHQLLDCLGPTLVSYMAGSRSRSTPRRWATPPTEPGHAKPAADKIQQIVLAHTVFTAIADSTDEHVARSWLISANPRFDRGTPADLIRSNAAEIVYAAAAAFVNDEYYA